MIIALHGNLGSTRDFLPVRPLGTARLRPVDLWAWSHLSLAEAAAALRGLAGEGPAPRGILGYSMGGRLALQALADFPDCWDFAIIISAHPGLADEKEKALRLQADQQWARLARVAPWEEFLQRWNAQPALRGSVPPFQSGLIGHREQIADAFENWSLGRQENLRERLAAYSKPILWMAGKRDEKFCAIAKEMAALNPKVELQLLEDCGHRVLLQRPDVVAEACQREVARFSSVPRRA